MSAPIIGVTTRNVNDPKYGFPLVASPKTYSQALIRSGAIPVLVPVNLPAGMLTEVVQRLDGLLFTGGGDIDIHHFQGEPHEMVYGVDSERDDIELWLARYAVENQIPFLGICRGIQVINVALGGTLYTHISDQLPGAIQHDCFPEFPPDHAAHPVEIRPGSLLNLLIGSTQVLVNSLHHQGINTLAEGLEPLAVAPDGLIEACHLPDHPFGLGVQWHPEWMPDVPEMQAIFSTFAARTAKTTKNEGRPVAL